MDKERITMREEVYNACEFLCSNLRSNSYTSVTEEQILSFRTVLEELIVDKFTNHWYPDKPLRGNGFRCINIDKDSHIVDPMLVKAAEVNNIPSGLLLSTFRSGLALWIDPGDVSYRTGRSLAIIQLYKSDVKSTKKAEEAKKEVPVLKTRPTQSNGFLNGFNLSSDKNIFASYPEVTTKKLKQIFQQQQQLDRFHWSNANYIPKRLTEVY